MQVTDTDAQDAAQAQLGKNHDQNIRDNRSPDNSETSNVASSSTSDPRKSSDGTPPLTTSSGGQSRPETLGKSDTQSKKKPADPNDGFEPWERELMEEMLNDVKGHLGEHLYTLLYLVSHSHPSSVPDSFLGRRGYCKQFPFQCRPVSPCKAALKPLV